MDISFGKNIRTLTSDEVTKLKGVIGTADTVSDDAIILWLFNKSSADIDTLIAHQDYLASMAAKTALFNSAPPEIQNAALSVFATVKSPDDINKLAQFQQLSSEQRAYLLSLDITPP